MFVCLQNLFCAFPCFGVHYANFPSVADCCHFLATACVRRRSEASDIRAVLAQSSMQFRRWAAQRHRAELVITISPALTHAPARSAQCNSISSRWPAMLIICALSRTQIFSWVSDVKSLLEPAR
jgi:hypothetical protein